MLLIIPRQNFLPCPNFVVSASMAQDNCIPVSPSSSDVLNPSTRWSSQPLGLPVQTAQNTIYSPSFATPMTTTFLFPLLTCMAPWATVLWRDSTLCLQFPHVKTGSKNLLTLQTRETASAGVWSNKESTAGKQQVEQHL